MSWRRGLLALLVVLLLAAGVLLWALLPPAPLAVPPRGAVLENVTVINPGQFLGLPGLGRLEPGAPADLLVLRQDPTRSLDALESLEAVVADGRLYTRAQLDEQLASYRRHSDGAIFDAVSVVLARQALARILD